MTARSFNAAIAKRLLCGIWSLFFLPACSAAHDGIIWAAGVNQSEFVREHLEQNLRQPLIRGVAYDAANERVFFSVCRPVEFACDLLVVGANQDGGPAQQLRNGEPYGYTWPAVSPDGARLAAVRTPRDRKPYQVEVEQELIEIDLADGAERVLATSNGGRFDRIQYTPSGLLVLRNYRSSEVVPCDEYLCADWGELLLFRGSAAVRLPFDALADGGIVGSNIDIVPLADGYFWIAASQRLVHERIGNLPTYRVYAWVLDAEGQLHGPGRNMSEFEQLLAAVPPGGWFDRSLLGGRVGRIEYHPFENTQGDDLQLIQINLAGTARAAFVRKLRGPNGVSLHVEALERGDGGWRSHWTASAEFPRR